MKGFALLLSYLLSVSKIYFFDEISSFTITSFYNPDFLINSNLIIVFLTWGLIPSIHSHHNFSNNNIYHRMNKG